MRTRSSDNDLDMERFSRTFPFFLVALHFLLVPCTYAQAGVVQDTLNQVDATGRKQGYWKVLAPVADKPGFDNGQVIEEGRYANSKRVGVWRRYWPNGNVMSEITYQFGRPRGEYRTYYPNGRVEEDGTWDLDRNTGKFQRWHPNGKLAQDFVFTEHGVRDGEQKYYHENGQLAVQVRVEEGREDGTLKRYTEQGQLQQVAQFNNGVIDAANSKYIKPVPKADDVKVDTKAPVAPAVSASESTNAITFRENGHNTLYDRQLRISQQGEFRNGRLHDGKRYTYDNNGILTRIQVYKGGRYAGDAVITDEDLR
ncbi:MAG: toxin-antitoxin system YwqK family antitoxin [Flavobacteriales bacterium]|nr:toxin-antitoxin system YwqK family antitoxin [Flavobacteriales bacterium]